jgi:hypothetical protein
MSEAVEGDFGAVSNGGVCGSGCKDEERGGVDNGEE